MDSGAVRIFTSSDSPRLRYTAGVILSNILGIEWEIITDRRKAGKSPVINYSEEYVKGSFTIIPSGLLFREGLENQEITLTTFNNLPLFFNASGSADFPFDIFAASFYLLSRYEEYLPFKADEHGRFPASEGIASRGGFLRMPVVELWANELVKAIIRKFPTLTFRKNSFRSLVTIDADQPFEYLGKDFLRSIGGMVRDLRRGSGKAGERYRTIARREKDPWNNFDFIADEVRKTGSDLRFFFPVGDRSKYDKNPSWHNEDYRSLIRYLSGEFSFGCHPSYYSYTDRELIKEEVSRLAEITGKKTDSARFHYLRLKFPDSYNALYDSGIRFDYSLGFHDEPGFRAGIARPFPFYDLHRERETQMILVPFQAMDATFFTYMKIGADDALRVFTEIIENTRRVGGLFVSVWHNTTLLETPEWSAWRSLFKSVLKSCTDDYIS